MQEEASVGTEEHVVGTGEGKVGVADEFCQFGEGEVGGDNTLYPVSVWPQRSAVGTHGIRGTDVGLIEIAEGIDPTCPAGLYGRLIPNPVGIIEVRFNHRQDSVPLVDGIDREIASALRQCIGFCGHRATVNAAVETHDTARQGLQRFGIEILLQKPCIRVGSCLYGTHENDHMLHGRVENAGRTLQGLLVQEHSHMTEEGTQAHNEEWER